MRFFFFIFLFTFINSSPFDPQPVKPFRRTAWFEGWFQRIIDHENQFSLAVILANYQASNSEDFTDAFISVLYTTPQGTTLRQVLLDAKKVSVMIHGEPVKFVSPKSAPSNFTWIYDDGDNGVIRWEIDGDTSALYVKDVISSIELKLKTSTRIPWDPKCPIKCGPEGWIQKLPFEGEMPLHYYIQSFGSKVDYEFQIEKQSLHGNGLLHLEANIGQEFPVAWIWTQGATEEYQFIMTGGEFVLFGHAQPQHIIGFRGPDLIWNFWDIDLDKIEYLERDACKGVLRVHAHSTFHGNSLNVSITADPTTFSDRIFTPMSDGIKNLTQESYHATIKLDFSGKIVNIPNSALEFGGQYLCNHISTYHVS